MSSFKRWIWTDAQRETLRRLYPKLCDESIAQGIGCTVSQARLEAKKLGLKKSPEFFAKQHALLASIGELSRFKTGTTPPNKGKRMPGLAIGRMGETQFKKGRAAQEACNYVPIGSTKICRDGYLQRKVTDDQSLASVRRWVAVHRLVWEAANGPIPKGFMVAFKGERTTVEEEITVDRLELISRAENARRNRMWTNYPPEVCDLIVRRGALNRRIRRLEREA